jgi:AraC-like DNA-binding protein
LDTFNTDQITAHTTDASVVPVFAPRAPFSVKLRNILRQNYSDPGFNLPRMAENMHLSERQLQRRIKDTMGESPVAFLRLFRLEMATRILKNGTSIAETAYMVGFTSQSYFAACFKAHFGTTATEFQCKWH